MKKGNKISDEELIKLRNEYKSYHVIAWADSKGTRMHMYTPRISEEFLFYTGGDGNIVPDYFTITPEEVERGTYIAKVINVTKDKNGYPMMVVSPLFMISQFPKTVLEGVKKVFSYLNLIPDLFQKDRILLDETKKYFDHVAIRSYMKDLCKDMNIKNKYGYSILQDKRFWARKTPEIMWDLMTKYNVSILKFTSSINIDTCSTFSPYALNRKINDASDKLAYSDPKTIESYPLTYKKIERMTQGKDLRQKQYIIAEYLLKMVDSYLAVFDILDTDPLDMVERINIYYNNKNQKQKKGKKNESVNKRSSHLKERNH